MSASRSTAEDTLQSFVALGAINPQHAIRLTDVDGLDRDAVDQLVREGRLRNTLFDDQRYYVPIQSMDSYVSPAVRKLSFVLAAALTAVLVVLWLLQLLRS